jgi:hypothetical protein
MSYYYKHPSTITVEADSKDEFDLYITSVLSADLNCAAVDRTGNLNTFAEIYQAIPPMATDKLDFNKLVDERTEEIVNSAIAYNKDIVLEWSGSLLSTVILISFTNYLNTLDIKPRVIAYVTQKGDSRRVDIYNKYLKNSTVIESSFDGINKIHINMKAEGKENSYVSVWDTNGQVLFSVGYVQFSDYDTKFSDVCEPSLYKILEPVLAAKPPLWDDTMSTAIHWLGFVFKWQWNIMSRLIKTPLDRSDIKMFYSSDKFQQWYMQVPALEKHPELINKKSQWQGREYIKQYHYDETLDLCNFVTGRGYNNVESVDKPNPLEYRKRMCVGIDTNFNKEWQDRDTQFEIIDEVVGSDVTGGII